MSPYREGHFFTPESQAKKDVWQKLEQIGSEVLDPLNQMMVDIDVHETRMRPDPDVYGPDTSQYPSVGELIAKIVKLQRYFSDLRYILADSSRTVPSSLTEDIDTAGKTAEKLHHDLIAADAQYQQRLDAWIQQRYPDITLGTASIQVRDAAEYAIAQENIAIATEENGVYGLELLEASETWFSNGNYDVLRANDNDLKKMHQLLRRLHTATCEDGRALLYYPAGTPSNTVRDERYMVMLEDPSNRYNTPSARKNQKNNIIALNNAIRTEEQRRYGFSTLPALISSR
jgi:hypothetical protein